MQFIYPIESNFLRNDLLSAFSDIADIEVHYYNFLADLESQSLDRAVELAVQRGLVRGVEPGSFYLRESVLRILDPDPRDAAFMIVPLNVLAAIAALDECIYRHEQYAGATVEMLRQLNISNAAFRDGNGARFELTTSTESYAVDLVRAVTRLIYGIPTGFSEDDCRYELSRLAREIDRLEPLVDNQWQILLNEAANGMAARFIAGLQGR